MTPHRTTVQEHRPTGPTTRPRSTGPDTAAVATPERPAEPPASPPVERRGTVREADTMAVVSFLSGLVGLLAMNLVLGPIAIVLAGLALIRGTSRPGRARLGLALGVADLVVLACLVSADHTWSWSLG
ncbi:hypothetical protein AB0P15_34675 [Streptomyces sp. NPDC087917]|uniref:hypothetical protein n=1 Tax=Streptomyces sp. NPDC087917 TaxID=3155060 RepID=UPI003418F532